VLAQLAKAKEKYSVLRIAVAENPNTPPEVLVQLFKYKDSHIREALAKNPNTPPFIRLFL
jgi:hypothetical protein